MFDNYEYFKSEFKKYDDHDWSKSIPNKDNYSTVSFINSKGQINLGDNDWEDDVSYCPPLYKDQDSILHPFGQKDMVNSPAHYTRGKQEAIEIIEEAIQDAPDVKAGMLQAQALKYMLRLWLKGNAPQDAKKANWYLTRLIAHLKETE